MPRQETLCRDAISRNEVRTHIVIRSESSTATSPDQITQCSTVTADVHLSSLHIRLMVEEGVDSPARQEAAVMGALQDVGIIATPGDTDNRGSGEVDVVTGLGTEIWETMSDSSVLSSESIATGAPRVMSMIWNELLPTRDTPWDEILPTSETSSEPSLSMNSSTLSRPLVRSKILHWCMAAQRFLFEGLSQFTSEVRDDILDHVEEMYDQIPQQGKHVFGQCDEDYAFFNEFIQQADRSPQTLLTWLGDAFDPERAPSTQQFAFNVVCALSCRLGEEIGSSAFLTAADPFLGPYEPTETDSTVASSNELGELPGGFF